MAHRAQAAALQKNNVICRSRLIQSYLSFLSIKRDLRTDSVHIRKDYGALQKINLRAFLSASNCHGLVSNWSVLVFF